MTNETSAAGLDFGEAIRALKAGHRVAREGWNGKGMWLALSCSSGRLTPADAFWSPHNAKFAKSQEHLNGHAMVLPCITMKTATGEILMGWLASQTDMLAEDWVNLDAAQAPASPQPKRYTADDIDDLRWATAIELNQFDDRVRVWVRMKDGKEVRSAFTPIQGERIGPAAAVHALRVANGEAP